jgi:hypothetical protein
LALEDVWNSEALADVAAAAAAAADGLPAGADVVDDVTGLPDAALDVATEAGGAPAGVSLRANRATLQIKVT